MVKINASKLTVLEKASILINKELNKNSSGVNRTISDEKKKSMAADALAQKQKL